MGARGWLGAIRWTPTRKLILIAIAVVIGLTATTLVALSVEPESEPEVYGPGKWSTNLVATGNGFEIPDLAILGVANDVLVYQADAERKQASGGLYSFNEVTLYDAGQVEIFNDADRLYIDVVPDEQFLIRDLYVFVDWSEGVPLVDGSGNPDLTSFTYQLQFDEPVPEHNQAIHLHDNIDHLDIPWGVPFADRHILNVAVHAMLVPKDGNGSDMMGAWAEGNQYFDEQMQRDGRRCNGQFFQYHLQKPGHGRFVDSPVGGLDYTTETYEDGRRTQESGKFLYYPGESVEFGLGGMRLGGETAKGRLTPLDLVGALSTDSLAVGNMARLLQSLDASGTPKDRINITPEIHEALAEAAAAHDLPETEGPDPITEFDFNDSGQIDYLIQETIARCVGLEGYSMGAVSLEDAIANLEMTLYNSKFRRNISKTETMYSTKSRIEIMQWYTQARNSQGESVTVDYYDYYDGEGALIESRDQVKPLVTIYLDEVPDTGGALDVFSGVSLDDGATWKRTNLSRHAHRSSFTLEDGTEVPGSANKPSIRLNGNFIHIVWTSSFSRMGSPRYSIKTDDDYPHDDPYWVDDIWGVSGAQGSTDYGELGYPDVGEVPYDVVWSVRGRIDKLTGEIEWRKPERLTSGRRNAMQLTRAHANGVGFGIVWQEDPEGVRPGSGKGPGLGWSGAIANHGTDIWYSYITLADFWKVDENFESSGTPAWYVDETDGDDEELRGRRKSLVPMSLPVRITDNEKLNTNNLKVELLEDGSELPATDENGDWIPITTEDGKHEGSHRYGYMLPDSTFEITDFYEKTSGAGELRQVAVTSDGRLMDGDTAATRPTLFLQPYTRADGTKSAWAVLAYEESKGLGGGAPDGRHPEVGDVEITQDSDCTACHGSSAAVHVVEDGEQCVDCHTIRDGIQDGDGSGEPEYKPDVGKNIMFHTFDYQNPDMVAAGTILNPQTIVRDENGDPVLDGNGEPILEFIRDEEGELILDHNGDPIPARENARRPRLMVQSKKAATANNTKPGTSMVAIFKMGESGQGGPSDVFIRRWEVQPTSKGNPYSTANLLEGVTNVSAITPGDWWQNPEWADTDEDKGWRLINWTQDESNLDDWSGEYPWDNAQGHRGYLKGDLLVIGYDWCPNWRAARNGKDIYNLYVRRSFDGGQTFTTTPESLGGVGATWSELFKDPVEDDPDRRWDIVEVTQELGPGEFEPARNISRFTNHKVNVIEPRTVGLPGTLQGSSNPEDVQDLSTMWLWWGTGAVYEQAHGNEEIEEHGKTPLDLMYTYSQDYGDTWMFEEKTVNINSEGNNAGEVVRRPFYLAKGDSYQGEVQARLSPDGSRAYVVWNDEGFPVDLETDKREEKDIFFRRIMPPTFPGNRAVDPDAYPIE